MKLKLILSLLFAGYFLTGNICANAQGFDHAAFYKVLKSRKAEEVKYQLTVVKASSVAEKEALEGTLLMTQAGMVSKAKEKLSLFKAGRAKLEAAIAKDNTNIEYRFLRLLIQEHAPKITKYRNNIDDDSKIITTNFRSLAPALQQVILDYSKNSAALKIS